MDTYGIALSGISNNAESKLDSIKNYNKDRQLIFVEELDSKHNVKKAFRVKSDIFNKNNWKELNKREIQEIINNANNIQK